ncbi:MAG: acetyl-CoA carboxylase biotin carboxyl carrier protein [Thermoguttaceae bacterium]|nr:acetyl-CoA carboxylase biotin carboxyl carrier protein [Thermoguttaceae bacterium]MDW8078968.1 acetyl-CoA carboxylase biotin carboxyl carrier protein [Thermoguttaceae bacterium]
MEESRSPGDVLDLEQIRRLMELMDRHGITELDISQGGTSIRIRRRVVLQRGAPVAAAATPPPAAPSAETPRVKSTEAEEEFITYIKSPMVGTFYASPDPDAEPFVKVGDLVSPDTTVCLIEAMKVFNPIPAGVSGKIVAVLVENGEAVDFGRPLFKVDCREQP